MIRKVDVPMSGLVSPPESKPKPTIMQPMSGMVTPPARKPNPSIMQPMSGMVTPPNNNQRNWIELIKELIAPKRNKAGNQADSKINVLY